MYSIEITETTKTANEMAALLRLIAIHIEDGKTWGDSQYTPTWELKEV